MNPSPFNPGLGAHAMTISRVAENQWHAVENDLVVGRGHAESFGARRTGSNLELVSRPGKA